MFTICNAIIVGDTKIRRHIHRFVDRTISQKYSRKIINNRMVYQEIFKPICYYLKTKCSFMYVEIIFRTHKLKSGKAGSCN